MPVINENADKCGAGSKFPVVYDSFGRGTGEKLDFFSTEPGDSHSFLCPLEETIMWLVGCGVVWG